MTQQKFVNHIGMKQSYLSRLENDEVDMSIRKLEDIVKKL
ncbi:helix-turn-helix transcriptional regulator [Salinibacillus aidingensis]